jgi:phage-related tail fiber protein
MSFNCLITTLGQAKIAAAIAAGTQISATHIAVGDGNGNATTPSVGQSSLVREVYRTNVSSVMVNPQDSSQVIFEAVISASVGGWTARELGLFDNAGVLIAVANIGAVYKPLAIEGSAREMVVRIYAQVNQVGAINLVVDPSFFIATRSWVQSNFSIAALLPGGTTGQILRKKSNASGDTEWANPLSAQNVTVDVVTEIQNLASGQTVVNLATANTTGTAIYVEGIRLRPNQYTVNSTTQFTLAQSYPANSKLLAVQNDPNASLDFAKKSLNLSDLASASSARANLGLGSMAVETAADYVAKSGGTMTGDLNLPGVSKTANGYTKLPNGMILQWGEVVDDGATKTFPITFPNACLVIVGSCKYDAYDAGTSINVFIVSTSQFRVRNGGTPSASAPNYWLALGY